MAVATALMLLGSELRLWAYRALGVHFTLELRVLEQHKLITSGPYQWVRHPGYTGALGFICGLAMWLFARGTFVSECLIGERSSWGWSLCAKGLRGCYAFSCTTAFIFLPYRVNVEEDMLRKEFKEEYEKFSETTKWKFVPLIW
jgi:protein-S-isoprenylcysteine O-methyltransferase Ste14